MKKILITAALVNEFPFNNYQIIYTGVGKVNATINLLNFLFKNTHIDLVINVGTAGGINCNRNEIIECGIFEDGQLEYPGSTEEIITFDSNKKKILTFDNFILSKPNKKCDCVDMESFALAKVCKKLNINFKCFKYITDIVGEKSQNEMFLSHLSKGKELLNQQVQKFF